MVGKRLGSYEISDRLGKGGMGEVYRAHDPRLRRDVAIKVLPAELTREQDLRARLEREAQLLATVQDPHVAAVYGLEEADDTLFLVMELVEGRGLDELVKAGPIAIDEALGLAEQIASGLAAAHECGIIHRDLKPSNVRVTAADIAKVLDFGLAKAESGDAEGSSSPSLSSTPTAALATMPGSILGTASYMSPEQVRGKRLDRRTDVWSFGCVLYEMLTGHSPFPGDTVADMLAAVMTSEPDWNALPAGLDRRIRILLRRCLEKDLHLRRRDLGDIALEIAEIRSGALNGEAAPPTDGAGVSTAPARPALAIAGWSVALVLGLLALWGWLGRPAATSSPTPLSWLSIPPDVEGMELFRKGERSALSLSPDGRMVVYAANKDGTSVLMRRSLDDPEHVVIEGSEGTQVHFFSPDGRSIAFSVDNNRLLVIPAGGGSPREVCKPCGAEFGGTWTDDGMLVVSPSWGSPLHAVSAAGGTPEPITVLDTARGDINHGYPFALPGGTHILFSIWTPDSKDRMAAVVRLSDRKVTIVARGGNMYRYADGHLLYEQNGVLNAVRFDLDSLQTSGAAFAIASGIRRVNADGFAAMEVSRNGMLAFQPGGDGELKDAVWVDRSGGVTPALSSPATFTNPALSPDERHLAVSIPVANSGYRVHVYDLQGGTKTELTSAGDSLVPLFSPDGRRVLFATTLFDDYVIARGSVDGSTELEMVVDTKQYAGPTDWSPDGRTLLFDKLNAGGNRDIWHRTEGAGEPRPLVETSAMESGASYSPDGKWIAYTSNATGANQLYVIPADSQGAPRQIAGMEVDSVRWSPAGGEIFISRTDGIWSLPAETEPALRVGTPVKLFHLAGMRRPDDARPEFDVTADGQRFILLRYVDLEPEQLQIHVIQNLPELLRRGI